MKISSFISYALVATVGSAYKVTGDNLSCRSGPTTSDTVQKSYAKDSSVTISCQTEGTSVNGNSIWDKTSDGCYVSDYYVKTGVDGYVTDKCTSSEPDGDAGPVKDDYPYTSSCGGVDKWNFYKCQCTSFVAWRINDRLGKAFTNRYKGEVWGNANTWDEGAKASGVTVNSTPKPGCIAQSNAGNYGHVAWVAEVSGSNVVVEEYNYETSEGYGKRTLAKSTFNYIHV